MHAYIYRAGKQIRTAVVISEKKRPRGLYDLLGNLLVKRMPVMYTLSSTKIPEYLTQR